MSDFYTNQAADNFRLARSKRFLTPADGTYSFLRVPKYAFVMDIWLAITTGYSLGGSPVLTIGFIGNGETADPDAFMDTSQADPYITGLKSMRGGNPVCADGKYFNAASGAITLTCDDDATATIWSGYVLVAYSVVY